MFPGHKSSTRANVTEKSNLAVCAVEAKVIERRLEDGALVDNGNNNPCPELEIGAGDKTAVEAKDIERRLEDSALVDNGNNNPCPELEIGAGVDPCWASDSEPRRDDPEGKDPNSEETDPKPNLMPGLIVRLLPPPVRYTPC